MVFIIVGGVAARYVQATRDGRRRRASIDGIMLKLPVLGLILRKIAVARFCRTLATLLARACRSSTASRSPRGRPGNAVVEDAIMATRKGRERQDHQRSR